MFAAADVYASARALGNLFPHLTDDARVVAFGAKLSHRRLGIMFNSFFRLMFSKLSFPSTPRLSYQPWSWLEERVGGLDVEEHFFGSMFLACGSKRADGKT